MPKGDKYLALATFLINSGKESIRITFGEIEEILDFKLPDSAYKHPTLWSNTKSHPIAFGWLKAGYFSRRVNMSEQTIEFVKEDIPKTKIKVKVQKSRKVRADLPVNVAVKYIKDYFMETVNDPHGRYLSWQHCYNVFTHNRNVSEDPMLDYLSLHLAFYLASWGMYRGSSFLLHKDYKIHIPVIKIIQEPKYNLLCGISAEELIRESNLDLLDEISERIREAYVNRNLSFGERINKATDTLVTKILLGTLGCVPAYDRYYVQTVKDYHISSGNYSRDSIKDVAFYYLDNREDFEVARKSLSACGTEYPPMKLMDMCMWQAAYTKSQKEKSVEF